ncbi:MAG: hypothetical protein HY678_02550 [Chloroflexi bacterium]|nr:hypothetical protein [Chloroflexota bacterium]
MLTPQDEARGTQLGSDITSLMNAHKPRAARPAPSRPRPGQPSFSAAGPGAAPVSKTGGLRLPLVPTVPKSAMQELLDAHLRVDKPIHLEKAHRDYFGDRDFSRFDGGYAKKRGKLT